ncbi:DUF6221 family protein [Streptomyces sp. ND04-05B]|uniref:DUF6221 family protein n=1 Tax=Streptomyces sp. ND04-05B TaxID=3028693 RepID=UPI0029A34D1D|nr:DUF6221 family protein [Streptomyces sp. ND04-05B]MDX3068734.1 DUF6221 family protein [Streptomyces sp. ND04-05B]
MYDLVQWLGAQLDADERDARARRGVFPSPGVEDDGAVWLHVRPGGNAAIVWYRNPADGYDDMAKLRDWASAEDGWTHERVLREIEAKRRIIGAFENYDREAPELDVPESVVRLLALPYADRPGYREEWRP